MTNGPLGYPLEPGSEAALGIAARHRGRQVFGNLRLVDRASSVSEFDHLYEICHDMRQPVAPKMEESATYDLIHLASDVVQIETVTYAGDLVLQWGGDDVYVLGNSVELRRAIANLVSNATRAAGPDGKVVVELRRDADRVLLTVDDSGPGFGLIRPGFGLGLQAVAHGLNTYGGSLEYNQSPLGGVQAVLALRAADAAGAGCDDASRHL